MEKQGGRRCGRVCGVADGIVAAVLAAGWLGWRRADWREEEGGRAVHTVSQGPAPAPQTRFPASGSASGRPLSASRRPATNLLPRPPPTAGLCAPHSLVVAGQLNTC